VADGLVTPLDTSTTLFPLTASLTGTANGTITTGVAPIDATVDALQTLTGGHVINVGGAVADATAGTYAIVLPVGAPMVAPYVALPGTLTFAADAAVAGKYGLSAVSGGVTKTAGPITLTAGGTVTTDFTFP
ncbi:MAG TPA: hypothetical protein VJ598_01800, partial [Albitalea sp.]|nr:hypothetical protein [Albitalea sp.]